MSPCDDRMPSLESDAQAHTRRSDSRGSPGPKEDLSAALGAKSPWLSVHGFLRKSDLLRPCRGATSLMSRQYLSK